MLGRDRTRIYALLRSGDLVAAPADEDSGGPVRIVRASLERWLVAGGARGAPLSPRNAWALIGLASGDRPFSERCLGLLERAEEVSRTRSRLGREKLVDLAPRLRRRATLLVRHLPRGLRQALEREAALVRTGASTAAAYGWDELADAADATWLLDAYLSVEAFAAIQEQLNQLDVDEPADEPRHGGADLVLLRVVDESWPCPPNYPIAPQLLAALDLLDYPDQVARRVGREVLNGLGETKPLVLARRSAKARAMTGPFVGRLLERNGRRAERPRVEGDPRTDTRAAAAHMVGVLWASASQGLSVKELRAAVGLSRQRFEDAYEFLGENPPLGLAVQRHGDELAWDLNYSESDASDWTIGITAAVERDPDRPVIHILDIFAQHLAEERHDVEIAEYIALWRATLVGIEKRAFEKQGATRDLIRSIRKLLEGRHAVTIEPVEADADKLSRAMIIPGRAKAGLISVDRSASWWHDLSVECSRFPRSAHDDRIDALSHLVRLAVERLAKVRALMIAMREPIPIEFSMGLEPQRVNPMTAFRTRTPEQIAAQRNAGIEAMLNDDELPTTKD